MSRGLDEEQTAVDTGILDVAVTLGCELLSQVCGVLVLDVLDDRVPTAGFVSPNCACCLEHQSERLPSLVVDLVTISGSVDNVQSQADTVFLND